MDEARRFLRFVLPGLTAVIEFLALVAVSWTGSIPSVPELNITLPVSALLIAAALGYVFSLFHHALLWTIYQLLGWTHDYRPLLRHAVKNGWLALTLLEDGKAANGLADRLTEKGAWRLLTALWHEKRDSSSVIRSANPRSDSLADLAHAAGAAFVGSFVAVLSWAIVASRSAEVDIECLGVALAAVLMVSHLVGVQATLRHSESFVQMVLADALRQDSAERNRPVEAVVTSRDLAT